MRLPNPAVESVMAAPSFDACGSRGQSVLEGSLTMTDGPIAELFDELSSLPPTERDRRLRGLEIRGRELRPSERRLLLGMLAQADRAAASPVDDTPSPSIDAVVRDALGAEAFPGVPRHELIARIGEGGHGVVYLARAAGPPSRFCALKVLRGDLDSRSALRRFEAERAALAELDHPAIIAIHDAGTTDDGRPFFAMPVVHGEPIDLACARSRVDLRGRVEMMLQVVDGVAHAHQRGILHRDLKPGNILAEEVEGGWRLRIIDWGLARALDSTATAVHELRTESLGGSVGTPEFMSPEQAEGGASRGDVRSDVWSLGAILYLLLTGTLPFAREGVRGLSPVALARHLAVSRPPVPSRAARGDVAINADLDAVVMMALEPNPMRRYQSVDALGDDLRAVLDGRPVRARPEGAARQLARVAHRHRVVAGAAALVATTLVVATVVATRAALVARESLQNAETSATFLQEILGGLEPALAQGRDRALLTEVLRTATARVGEYDARDPVGAARIRLALAKAWFDLGYRADAEQVAVRGIEMLTARTDARDPVLRALLLVGARAADGVDNQARFRAFGAQLLVSGTRAPGFILPVDAESCALLARALEPLHVPVVVDGGFELERLDYTGPDAPEVERRFARESAEVLAHIERARGADSPQAVEARINLLRLGLDREPKGSNISELLREIERLEGRLDLAMYRVRAMGLVVLGHHLAGRDGESVAYASRVLPEATSTMGPAHPIVLNIRYNRAIGLRTLGRHDEAIPELLALVRGQRRASGVHSGRTEWVDRATLDAISRFGTAEQANDYLQGYLDDCAAFGEQPSREADIRVRLRALLAEPDTP